jgi:hypothetical protein
MIRFISQFFSIFLMLGIFYSCSPKVIMELPIIVERKKTDELVFKLDSIHNQIPTTFYSKISTKYKDTTQNLSFKTSITVLKDSVLGALVSYAGIPLINSFITKDSLLFTNKREKCYTKNTLDNLKVQFGVDFDFKNIQELILGLPLNFQSNSKYYQIHDPNFYIISNHKKREIKKLERKNLDDYIIKYYSINYFNSISKILIENPKENNIVEIRYLKFQFENGYTIPKLVEVEIKTDKNHINVELEYEKVEINEPQDVFFTIPDNYENCN